MLVPAAFAFLVGTSVMSLMSNEAMFKPELPMASSVSGGAHRPELSADLMNAEGAVKHWRTILFFATHVPEVCWGDNAVNDFQRKQCGEFWEKLQYGGALACLPLLFLFVFFQIAWTKLQFIYRRAQKQISEGKVVNKGVVTDPAKAPSDIFSMTYCLEPIAVQLKDKKQVVVYCDPSDTLPKPGQEVVYFEGVRSFGQKRHFAILYAPHLAVVSGVRN